MTTVAELEVGTLEALLAPEADGVEATELRELAVGSTGELAGTELEYCGGDMGPTTVVEDATGELDPLLTPGAEGVTVGYMTELGITGADGLDDAADAETEVGGSGMTTV